MNILPYLSDARQVAVATDLVDRLGLAAADEAAARAVASRNVGNHIHFCRWRQVERLAVLLSAREAVGTVH